MSTPCGTTSRPTSTRSPPRAARPSPATRCGCSTPSERPTLAVIAAAPQMADFLSDGAAEHFATVRAGLDALGIPFRVEPRLVRGLDYYLRTTFEFAGGTLDSAQNALGGGGRYDGLVEALGGPPTPGVGFALGIDRTLLACDDEGVFARAGAVGRRLRRRHDRRRRGPRRHRRAAPRRALRRPRLRRTQHEGADEGRRPQRRRRRRDHRRRRAGGRHRRRPAAARRRRRSPSWPEPISSRTWKRSSDEHKPERHCPAHPPVWRAARRAHRPDRARVRLGRPPPRARRAPRLRRRPRPRRRDPVRRRQLDRRAQRVRRPDHRRRAGPSGGDGQPEPGDG